MSEEHSHDNNLSLPEETLVSTPLEVSEDPDLQPGPSEATTTEGLGALALTGGLVELSTTPSQSPSRNAFERFLDRRADKKALKKAVADTYAYRAEKIFGPKDELSGFNKDDRKTLKAIVKTDEREGRATATEARRALGQIDALPLRLGEEMHKRAAKDQARTTRRLNRAWGNVTFPELEADKDEGAQRVIEVDKELKSPEQAPVPSRRERIATIRDNDIELKEREQVLRARELEQRERALRMREEAMDRGEIIDIPTSGSSRPSRERPSGDGTAERRETSSPDDYWKDVVIYTATAKFSTMSEQSIAHRLAGKFNLEDAEAEAFAHDFHARLVADGVLAPETTVDAHGVVNGYRYRRVGEPGDILGKYGFQPKPRPKRS